MKTEVETARFGRIEVSPEDIFLFPQGLIGFEALKRFVILDSRKGGAIQWLQAVDDPNLAFLVSDPRIFIPSFELKFPESAPPNGVCEDFHAESLKIFTMLSIDRAKGLLHVHIQAPILLDASSRKGAQLITDAENPTISVSLQAAAGPDTPADPTP